MSHYHFLDQHRRCYPVCRLCQVLGVTPSRYYAWQQCQQVTAPPAPAWEVTLDQTFGQHKKRYGTRRLRVALHQQGHRVGRQALHTAMRRRGLRASQPKAYTPRTTDSTHGLRCAPNRLLDQPPVVQANRLWVSDIAYLPLASGPTYTLSRTWPVSTSGLARDGHHARRVDYPA